MSWSSQPVLIWLRRKLSVSNRVMTYSTIVQKSPWINSSFRANTMCLVGGREGGTAAGWGDGREEFFTEFNDHYATNELFPK